MPSQPSQTMLQVLEISQISPPPGSVPETSLPLTFLDVVFLPIGAINRIFFYNFPCPTSHFIGTILPNFKSSLSLALQQFFPLAGKIRLSPGSEEQYELHYKDGDSATVTVAECRDSDDFAELSKSHPKDLNRLTPLQPELLQENGTWPAFALQVTLFPGRGIAVGVAVHHGACDGSSSIQFIYSWASACKGSEFAFAKPPVFDRSSISDPQGLYRTYLEIVRAMLEGTKKRPQKPVTSESQVAVIATFTLTSQQIQELKEKLSCSTAVASYAYAWVCLIKARRFPGEKIAYMGFPANCRSWLDLPLPPNYFGNCLVGCLVEGLRAAELVDNDDGLATAAKAISKVVKETKNADVSKAWERFSDRYGRAEDLFSVAGSPRFRIYEVDFGWGRPLKVEVTSIAKTGAMALAENREDEGGVEIGIALPKDEMDEFAAQFNNGLRLL